MASNETDFTQKLKRIVSGRAFAVTAVTLLAVLCVVIAVTVSANRSKRPPDAGDTGTDATSGTMADPAIKDETLPVYNGGETRPVSGDAEEPTAFLLPVSGKLQKGHDATIQVYSNTMGDYRIHLGLDIATAAEAPVYAAAAGTVEKVWEDALMGHCVAITHADNTVSIYKNLAKELADGIAAGVTVKAGQELGRVGDSASLEMADEPHLHYEMTVNGLPVDPLKYFSDKDVATLAEDTAFESSAVESGTEAMTRPNGK